MKQSLAIARAIYFLGQEEQRKFAERVEISQLIRELETIMLEMQQKEMQLEYQERLMDTRPIHQKH